MAKELANTKYEEDPFINTGSKWFDGYTCQKVIIIEDMDRTNAYMYKHHLKIWGDKYSCTAEVKGGVVTLYHRVIVVTSNLTIE